MAQIQVERKISFPVDAVFQSAVHDCDNAELWKVLRTSRCHLELDRPTHSGLTALHISVLQKNLDGVKMLLGFGADPDIPDENGFTPLHTASAAGLLQIAAMLLLHHARVFALTKDGDLPVDLATDSRMVNLLTTQMLQTAHRELYLQSWIIHHLRVAFKILMTLLTAFLQLTVRILIDVVKFLAGTFIYHQSRARNKTPTENHNSSAKWWKVSFDWNETNTASLVI